MSLCISLVVQAVCPQTCAHVYVCASSVCVCIVSVCVLCACVLAGYRQKRPSFVHSSIQLSVRCQSELWLTTYFGDLASVKRAPCLLRTSGCIRSSQQGRCSWSTHSSTTTGAQSSWTWQVYVMHLFCVCIHLCACVCVRVSACMFVQVCACVCVTGAPTH